MSYLENQITDYINKEKEKFFDLDMESDYGDIIDFEMQCKNEMKINPIEFGPLINCGKEKRIYKFELFPDFEFGVMRRKYMTDEERERWLNLFKGSQGRCF